MELYLVRHGAPVPAEVNPERPLSEKGAAEVKKTALFLKEAGVVAETIFHSTKRRARETAEILTQTINPQTALLEKQGLAPNDSVDAILPDIRAAGESSLMIVGHLPFLAKLAGRLILSAEDKEVVVFQPASVLLLAGDNENWQIRWFITPALLPDR